MVAVHTAIAIVLVIALIIRMRVDPVISLVLGSLYLGLAGGVGFAGTIEAITLGFGGIMAEVGLLIGFGVLIGALLHSTGAFRRLVEVLVRGVGAQRLPYAMASLLAMVMPSIYVDVQVVLAAPVARSASPVIGRVGLPVMASALGGGIFAGYVFVIPGLAAISIAGLLDIKARRLAALRPGDRLHHGGRLHAAHADALRGRRLLGSRDPHLHAEDPDAGDVGGLRRVIAAGHAGGADRLTAPP
jgi:GntP family gluconate:H+ symporter